MEGGLRAWEALQRALKVAVKDLNALEVWARVKQWDISPNKSGNFIVCDCQIDS
jgi:hypothetical protein